MYTYILVATDGSKLSKKAFLHAIRMAQLNQAELLVLKVIPKTIQAYFDEGMILGQREVERIEKSWLTHAHGIVDQLCELAHQMHVHAEPIVHKSDVIYEGILEIAKSRTVDLIVMSSHGRKGVKKFLLGSETQSVLVHSSIPVLVLR
jgi:nucleotide-binding universal stress UspA family protein